MNSTLQKIYKTEVDKMKTKLFFLLFLAVLTYGCGTSSLLNTPGTVQKTLFETSTSKEPQWVLGSKVFWYDPKDQCYYVVGVANDQSDLGFGSSIAQAIALKNLAQRIQTIFNSRFALIETGKSDEVRNLGDLLVSAVTNNIQLSVAMTEQYWKEWQINDGYQARFRYDIYTLNQISRADLDRAIASAVEGSKQHVEDPELRSRLDKFENDVQKELGNVR